MLTDTKERLAKLSDGQLTYMQLKGALMEAHGAGAVEAAKHEIQSLLAAATTRHEAKKMGQSLQLGECIDLDMTVLVLGERKR